VQQLTKSLLKRDFGLSIELPGDRLCPPVPNRLNYLLWIQRLLDTTSETYSEREDGGREVLGLDVGTGASCIYPLLGCKQRERWRFAGTDIDDKSLQYARRNVETNGLQKRIKLLKTEPKGLLIPLDLFGFEKLRYHFMFCWQELTVSVLTSACVTHHFMLRFQK
jgi:23S rRNA (adenine1618-N6)-methyltransferase